jgi:hypothetical protein
MSESARGLENPFRPGAGHPPPYLAGRVDEKQEFLRLLDQSVITENVVLTGLRGLGKTVLLDTFKPLAIQRDWLWAGTDLSESTSISEEKLAVRLLTDLSIVTSSIVIGAEEHTGFGFLPESHEVEIRLNFNILKAKYDATPGLVIDKLKGVFEVVWPLLSSLGKRGLIFAYDEAQNMADHAAKEQFPLSLLLDLFQSIQRKNIPFMLVLTGLPTLFPKLVEARTFAERMFRVIALDALNRRETEDAIREPIKQSGCPLRISPDSYQALWEITKGYPYFIQFVCRECFDVWVQCIHQEQTPGTIPTDAIIRKLDVDFFAGRWARATDRQRDLLSVVAQLDNCDSQFSVQEVVESPPNRQLAKPFSSSHVNQIFASLIAAGLIYKNRHGRYSLAVPLLGDFIRRNRLNSETGK